MNTTIQQYIQSQRSQGKTDAEIRDALLNAGWTPQQLEGVFMNKSKKKKKIPWVVIVILIAVLIIAGGIFWFVSREPESSTTDDTEFQNVNGAYTEVGHTYDETGMLIGNFSLGGMSLSDEDFQLARIGQYELYPKDEIENTIQLTNDYKSFPLEQYGMYLNKLYAVQGLVKSYEVPQAKDLSGRTKAAYDIETLTVDSVVAMDDFISYEMEISEWEKFINGTSAFFTITFQNDLDKGLVFNAIVMPQEGWGRDALAEEEIILEKGKSHKMRVTIPDEYDKPDFFRLKLQSYQQEEVGVVQNQLTTLFEKRSYVMSYEAPFYLYPHVSDSDAAFDRIQVRIKDTFLNRAFSGPATLDIPDPENERAFSFIPDPLQIEVTLNPGESTTQDLVLTKLSNHDDSKQVWLKINNFIEGNTTDYGTLTQYRTSYASLSQDTSYPVSAGEFISLPSELLIPDNPYGLARTYFTDSDTLTVPISIGVPVGTEPGEYVSTLVVEVPNKTGFELMVIVRVGEPQEKITITNEPVISIPDYGTGFRLRENGFDFNLAIENKGSTVFWPEGEFVVHSDSGSVRYPFRSDLFFNTYSSQNLNLQLFVLPGTSYRFPVDIPFAITGGDQYSLDVLLEGSDGTIKHTFLCDEYLVCQVSDT